MESQIKNSLNEFSLKFYNTFLTRHPEYKNVFFSPFVIYTSLSVLYVGAKEKTKDELKKLLFACLTTEIDDKSLLNHLQHLIKQLITNNRNYIFTGNFFYYDHTVKLHDNFKNIAKTYFELKPKRIEFSKINDKSSDTVSIDSTDETPAVDVNRVTSPVNAVPITIENNPNTEASKSKLIVEIINKDMLDATEKVVDEVITQTMFDSTTKLLLVNSILFRGYWTRNFTKMTKDEIKFNTANGEKISTVMMSLHGYLNYYYFEEDKLEIIQIPYEVNDLSMLILLPKDVILHGNEILKKFNAEKFFHVLDSMEINSVNVIIPKFALDVNNLSVKGTLKVMGAKTMFDQHQANLTNVTDNKQFELSRLVHKAFIIIDEKGQKISTAYQQTLKNDLHIKFHADHPFMFMIVDHEAKTILFMGFFGDPRETLEVVDQNDLTKDEINLLLKGR